LEFFSGFCLRGESELFSEFLSESEYEVAGFSYGAIKAFEYVLKTTKRVDALTLLSPAFFIQKSQKFKRLQLLHFKKDKDAYIKNFLENCSYPSKLDLNRYFCEDSYEDLEKLLNYEWREEDFLKLKGIDIKVYLAEDDKIINSKNAMDFFKKVARVYYIKGRGHILCKV